MDVIISVGYRVKSPIGTRFRQWANVVLRDYLLQGYSVNRHLIALQENMDKRMTHIEDVQAKQQQQLDFFIRTIIDGYVSSLTLSVLDVRKPNVTATIYTV